MKQSVISLVSPAGGTGKSTLSKELSCYFGARRKDGIPLRVCLLDGDLHFGCQRALLRVPFTQKDLGTFLSDVRSDPEAFLAPKSADARWDQMSKYFERIDEYGIYLMTAPEKCVPEAEMTAEEAGILIGILKDLFDIVVIDTPSGLSGLTKASLSLSRHLFFVMADDQRSLAKMLMLRRSLLKEGDLPSVEKRASVILNRCPGDKRRLYLDPSDVEEILRFPVSCMIPDFPDTLYYNNRFRSLSLSDTPFSAPVRKLSEMFTA